MLTDFHSYFTDGLTGKFAIKSSIIILPHLKPVATLPCETSVFKKHRARELSKVNCRARISHLRQ